MACAQEGAHLRHTESDGCILESCKEGGGDGTANFPLSRGAHYAPDSLNLYSHSSSIASCAWHRKDFALRYSITISSSEAQCQAVCSITGKACSISIPQATSAEVYAPEDVWVTM